MCVCVRACLRDGYSIFELCVIRHFITINECIYVFHSKGNNSSLPSGGNRHLVEFRAGRMTMDDGKMVHPDSRKGLLYVYQGDDGLIHFCWKNRTTNKVEKDLIIFPDDCEFKRVEQCKTGRVYLLKVSDPKCQMRSCSFRCLRSV